MAGVDRTRVLWWGGLALLVLLHFGIVGLFYTDILPDPNHSAGTFHFHHGGDENDFFALALSLQDGTPAESRMTLGYPLLLQPALALTGARQIDPLIESVALFNAVVLFPLAQVCLATVSARITRSQAVALLAVLLWTVLPVLIYFALSITGRASLGTIWGVHYIWAQMLSDPPAAFLTLAAFWLALRCLDTNRRVWSVALGVVCGLLLLIRVNTVLSVGPTLLALALAKRLPAALVAGALAALVFAPQLVYNTAFFGGPLAFGYSVLDTEAPYGLLSPQYSLDALQNSYAPALVAGGLACGAVMLGGGWLHYRRSGPVALMISGTALAYLLFFAMYYYSWTGGLSRFLIPAAPAFALLAVSLLGRAWESMRFFPHLLVRSAK